MKMTCILFVMSLLAVNTLAQNKDSAAPHPVQTQGRVPLGETTPRQSNRRLGTDFGGRCCWFGGSTLDFEGWESAFPDGGFVSFHGGVDWKRSHFMPFSQALSVGQQESEDWLHQPPTTGMIQQMLDLIQEERMAAEAAGGGRVKWADLQPAINPADYRRQPSTFLDYPQALALGEAEEAAAQNPDPAASLGEVAREQRESKPAGEKAKVKIKQTADGTPVIVQKQQ